MVAYPETQRKAREELDEVVGSHNNLLKIDIISGKTEFAMGSRPPGALYRSVQVSCPHFDALKQTLRP